MASSDTGDAAHFDTERLGIAHPGRIYANLSPAELTELAVRRGEVVLTDLGGDFTGELVVASRFPPLRKRVSFYYN